MKTIIKFALAGVATYITSKIVVFSLLFILVVSASIYKGYDSLAVLSKTFDVHNTHYVISAVNCKQIINGNDGSVIYTKRQPSYLTNGYTFCLDENQDMVASIINEHHSAASGANTTSYIVYVFVFLMYIMLCMSFLLNPVAAGIATRMSRTGVVVVWLMVSLVLYPLTFMSEKAVTKVSYDGINYNVTSIIMSYDKQQYIPTSSVFVDKMRASLTNSPRNITKI